MLVRPSVAAAVPFAAGALLFASQALAEPLTTAQRKCAEGLHGALRRVAAATTATIAGCLTRAAKGTLAGPLAACTTGDPRGAIAKATGTAAELEARRCTGTDKAGSPKRPAFGVAAPAAAAPAVAAKEAALVAAVLGPDLDAALVPIADDKAASKCQRAVLKAVTGCEDAWLGAFNACAAAGFKHRTAPIGDAAALAACIGADPKGTRARACGAPGGGGKLGTTLAKKCRGVALAAAFPGCAVADPAPLHACLATAVACRACRALVESVTLARDCDALDDGLANASCPGPLGPSPTPSPTPPAPATATATPTPTPTPTRTATPTPAATPLVIGPQTCTLSADDSTIAVFTHEFFLFRALGGTVELDCGAIDPASGRGVCTCRVVELDPVEVTGIGWACLRPAAGCPAGTIDCDGGAALDLMTTAHHTLGACDGNASCAAACASACAAAGAEMLTSGCEGFCAGGANDGAACAGDLLCPHGICTGPDFGPHGNVCQCQCLARGGAPAPGAGLACNLGVDVAVESALPCGDGDVVLEIGPRCVAFTTGATDTVIRDADNVPDREVRPDSAFYGIPRGCDALATSGPGALTLAATAGFLDAPVVGDMAFTFIMTCAP